MFRKLRNRLILINLAITTAVLFAAFSTIYIIARSSLNSRPLITVSSFEYSSAVVEVMRERVIADRRATLESLLSSLIATGLIVEIAVALASYFWAEAAIHPVEENYESQKTFIANASHEIKTPLAAISANLEAADIQDNHWIDNISREVQTLTHLNHELLALAQADAVPKQAANALKTVSFRSVVDTVVADFESRLTEQQIDLKISITPAKARLTINRPDFEQLFTILLDNAVKYCDHQISLFYKDHTFSIKNDGKTISKQELPQIFERFYQTDKTAAGVGLGLAIAAAIAKRNHWKLTATSDQASTTFSLEF